MTFLHPTRSSGFRATVLAVSGLSLLAPSVGAQAFRSEVLGAPIAIEIQIEASNPEIVKLLAGIGEIRGDLQLGLLFLEEGLSHPEGSHFANPRKHVWPHVKDGLAAAGVPDLEPLLQKLETTTDKEAVQAAYGEVEAALMKARSTLNPTSSDVLLSLVEMTKDAGALINATGPTDLHAYQEAWAIIIAARGELDLLARDPDPAIAKLAAEEAMAFDDLIISMPDPHQPAAVEFDPALINDLIARLEKMHQSA